jgi:hypothetical protein
MVRRALKLLAVLCIALPLVARAQTTEEKKPAGPTFTPYGFILLNAFMSSRAFAADDYPQYAIAPGVVNPNGRFGVRIGNFEALGAKLGAVIEMDFGYGFVSAAPTPAAGTQGANFDFYKPIARMRLGYATATWDVADLGKFTLLLGQDYGLVNPLFAVTLGYIGTPLFQNAGNLYTRSPMVKLTGDFGKDAGITAQVAVMNPMDQNEGAAGVAQQDPTLSSGDRARLPQVEGRLAARAKTDIVAGELGVSGSWHKERYLLGAPTATARTVDLDSLIGGVDLVLKFPFVEVRGEGFMGHNADMYFAHLGQGGTNFIGGANVTDVQNKRTKGFWAQAIVSPIPVVQLTAGYGTEQPFSEDIAVGARSQNTMASAGIILSASKNLKFSAEGAWTWTKLKGSATGFDNRQDGYQTVLSSQFTF